MTKIALLTLCSSDDSAENVVDVIKMCEEAVSRGAKVIFTPEVINCISTSRSHQNEVLVHEDEDAMLLAMRDFARDNDCQIVIGSLALKTKDDDGRFANRSFVIDRDGQILARYDKIHMFDVSVSEQETYKESDGYRPGDRLVVSDVSCGKIGLAICYDVRFPHLHRALAKNGAEILSNPAAFSFETGKAHWEVLLRARAIETGCFVVAAAQSGQHKCARGKSRLTHGHSLVVSPWGEVVFDGGKEVGVGIVDIDINEVAAARRKIPSLSHDRPFKGL